MTPLSDLIHSCARQSSTDDLAEWLAQNMAAIVHHLNPQPDLVFRAPTRFMFCEMRWTPFQYHDAGMAPRNGPSPEGTTPGWLGTCYVQMGSRSVASVNWTIRALTLMGIHVRSGHLLDDGIVEITFKMFAGDFANLAVMRRLQGMDIAA